MKEIKNDKSEKEAYSLMQAIEKLFEKQANFSKQLKEKQVELEELTLKKYDKLTEAEVKDLVINKKMAGFT
jgi:type I restriction enzyme M protein